MPDLEGREFVALRKLVVDIPMWWIPFALSWKRQVAVMAGSTIVGFMAGLAIAMSAH